MKKTFLILLLFIPVFISFSQRGKDGDKIVTGTEIVNEYTYLTADALTGGVNITVQQSSLNANGRFGGTLVPGDLLYIYNAQGADLNGAIDVGSPTKGIPQNSSWGEVVDYNNVGLKEFAEVQSVVSATQIELTCPLKFDHTVSGVNEKVVVVRVPRYNSLTVNTGVLTCDPWNGNTGGMLVVEVLGITSVNGGSIDVSGLGFRGGELNSDSQDFEPGYTGSTEKYGGEKGESLGGYKDEYNPYGGAFGRGAPANGGGGGNSHNGGGGGGANAGVNGVLWTGYGVTTVSQAWEIELVGLSGSRSSGGGRGGHCLGTNEGDAFTLPPGDVAWGGHGRREYGGLGGRPMDYSTGRIFFGGGGGSGHQNDGEGGGGGNAGGIIVIHSYNDIDAEDIYANGENGTGSAGLSAPFGQHANRDGSGGGGAGGTILITATGGITYASASGFVGAQGGAGGVQVLDAGTFAGPIEESEGPGAGGGGGYIAMSDLSANYTFYVQGGDYGTTNSPSLAEFPENGASSGDSGIVELVAKNYHFFGEDTAICGGASLTLSPTIIGVLPTGTGQLEWFDSYLSQTPIHTGNTFTTPVLNTTTTYYFGGCGIHFKDSIRVTVSSPVVIETNAMVIQDETCIGMDGSITGIAATGGLGGLDYFWNSNMSTSLDTFNLGETILELIVIDSVGCSDTVSNIVVEGISVPTIDTTFKTLIADSCEKNTGEINGLFVTGGSGSYLYRLDGTIVPSLTIKDLATGQYLVSVEDNSSGCKDSVMVFVDEVIPPTTIFGNDTTLCTGQTLTLDATITNAAYEWQDASTSPIFAVTMDGLYWVEISIGGCSTRDSINVTFVNGVGVDLGNDTVICSGQGLFLDATVVGGSYTWQDNSMQATYDVATAGEYSVEVDQNGCVLRDTINVDYASVSVVLGNDTTLCDQATITLDITSPSADNYLWDNGSTDSVIQVSSAGTYYGVASIGNCSSGDSIMVTYVNTPAPFVGNDTSICDGDGFVVDVFTPGVTYLWDDGSISSTRYINQIGQYILTMSNFCGSANDTIQVEEMNCSCDVFLPNTFTPNKNGINEVLKPVFACELDLFELRIYNRQGIKVYEVTDPIEALEGWNGEHRGGVNEAETYAYLMKYRAKGEIVIEYRDGHINLIR